MKEKSKNIELCSTKNSEDDIQVDSINENNQESTRNRKNEKDYSEYEYN